MRVLILICVLSGFLVASCNRNNDSESDKQPAEVRQMMSDSVKGGIDKRLREINYKIVADPGNGENYHERAYIYFHMGDLESAIRDINKAIDFEKNNASFYFSKGYFFHAKLYLEEAKTAFETCLKLDPNYADAHLFLARIYLALASPNDKYRDNYDRARNEINELLKIDPKNAEAYFWRGWIYEEMRDSGAALSSFKTATELDPDYYDAFLRLGLLYSAARNDRAVYAYQSALDIKPESQEAWFALGKHYQDALKLDEAEAAYKKTVELDSFYVLAYINLGYMYMTYDTAYDKAIEYLHRAVYFNPGTYLPMVYTNIGVAFELKGNYVKARKYYKEALKVNENHINASIALDKLDRKGL